MGSKAKPADSEALAFWRLDNSVIQGDASAFYNFYLLMLAAQIGFGMLE